MKLLVGNYNKIGICERSIKTRNLTHIKMIACVEYTNNRRNIFSRYNFRNTIAPSKKFNAENWNNHYVLLISHCFIVSTWVFVFIFVQTHTQTHKMYYKRNTQQTTNRSLITFFLRYLIWLRFVARTRRFPEV